MVMRLMINKELWTAETVLEIPSEMGGNNTVAPTTGRQRSDLRRLQHGARRRLLMDDF
jgi:hypothetical protein